MRSSVRTTAIRLAVLGCVLAGVFVAAPASASSDREVRLRDDCEPASFNAELAQRGSVNAWKYDNDHTTLDGNQRLLVVNRGGETHTFTKVARFGGGFVAPLNQASGNPVPATECATVQADGSLVPKPASATNQFVAAHTQTTAPNVAIGTTLFQCCIHPWMRIRVERR